MKIAIATDQLSVSEHFGRCPQFTIVDIQNGQLINRKTIDNPGHHPGFLPQFFRQMNVDSIVAGGLGLRAQMLFDAAGIKTFLGTQGSIDETIEKLIKGLLISGQSFCQPGQGKGYGLDKTTCDHDEHNH